MKDFMIMEPTNLSFQELIGNGIRYTVPRFQRDYTWGLEQWEDLWADIETLAEEQYHYMGYIVLQRKSQHDFEVIDGQQRLVTLSLVVLAYISKVKELIGQGNEVDDNKERLKVLMDRYIGSKNPVSLRVDNKISLNRNNGAFFKSICSNLDAPTRRGITSTNKLIQKAFTFFSGKIELDLGAIYAEKIDAISSGMMFTRIVVQDDLNAYKVFETLNARGVQLSTPDLLKNYIFSVVTQEDDVPEHDLNDLDERWSEIVEQLGEANFTDFIRYHHNVQSRLTTKKDLFKSIRRRVNTPEKAYAYLSSLTEYSAVYGALLNPSDEFWQSSDQPELKDIVHYLEGFRLFNIKQPFSILMTAYFGFSAAEFVKLVRYLFSLSVRYNVICHYSTNEQEKLNNQIAMKIFNGDYTRASHIKNGDEFKKLYPSDDVFRQQFSSHKMPTRQSSKKVRYLLSFIENHLGHKTDYSQTTLEHVCPYQPSDVWHSYFGDGINDAIDRLGNVVLLDQDQLKRADFEEKKKYYQTTPFKLAEKVASYKNWDLYNLNNYQAWLADQAVATWRVD